MPAFYFDCANCGKIRRLLDKYVPETPYECPKCKSLLTRSVTDTLTVQVKEVLDNGIMPKAVERFKDAEQLFDDNSKIDKYAPKD